MDSCKEKYETDACEPFSIAIGVGLIAGWLFKHILREKYFHAIITETLDEL